MGAVQHRRSSPGGRRPSIARQQASGRRRASGGRWAGFSQRAARLIVWAMSELREIFDRRVLRHHRDRAEAGIADPDFLFREVRSEENKSELQSLMSISYAVPTLNNK